MKNFVRKEQADVNERLSQLGVTAEILRDAVSYGEMERSLCTGHDPFFFPGLLGWGRTVRALRDRLVHGRGWEARNRKGIDIVVSPDGSRAIAVANADEWTGRPEGAPRTNPKGNGTAVAVAGNQLSLFEDWPGEDDLTKQEPGSTWYLLIHSTDDEVRCELSLPTAMGDDSRIESWAERIILEPLRREPEVNTDAGPEVDVDVSRKTS